MSAPGGSKPRLLLLLPTTSYRIDAFLEAAARAGADIIAACDRRPALAKRAPESLATLDFTHPDSAAGEAATLTLERPIRAVLGVDDASALAAAAIAEALLLSPRNPIAAVEAAGNKKRLRETLRAAGVPTPPHRVFSIDQDPEAAAREVPYPCVLKPLHLSASRGVIRADNEAMFADAFGRIAAILREPDVAARGGAAREILAEDFVPGPEVALEGLLVAGRLHVLALFDKPDPLDGPFFEETIYVTPSRLPEAVQRSLIETAARAATALGLREGALHAELRIGPAGPQVIEVAARSIGGLCARVLRFENGESLEDLLVRHALGALASVPARERLAAGVMMIPIPKRGTLREVRGRAQAMEVTLVEDVSITAHTGANVAPPPEGSSYLGFIFARGERPEEVEAALRRAHARLEFVIEPEG